MNIIYRIVAASAMLLLANPLATKAQDDESPWNKAMKMKAGKRPDHKAYLSSGIDGYLLSSAMTSTPSNPGKLTTPRFTAFLHLGTHLNYDFNRHIGIYSGLNIKNIGFIEKSEIGDLTTKRRNYTFGLPLGIKLGNVKYGSYFLLGGGIDFPFHFKEKSFVKRTDKVKLTEWFSQRSPAVLPYAFVGAHIHPGLAVKLQYYPTNFLNPDFTTLAPNGSTIKPYAGYEVNLVMLTLGFDISYSPRH